MSEKRKRCPPTQEVVKAAATTIIEDTPFQKKPRRAVDTDEGTDAAKIACMIQTGAEELPLTGNIMVERLSVLKNRQKGVATNLLTKRLLPFARKHGFAGVSLNQAMSPFGAQLLRSLVTKHNWATDGIMPAKIAISEDLRICGRHVPLPTLGDYDDEDEDDEGITRIKRIEQLGTWVDAARAVGGCFETGLQGVAREFLLVGLVGDIDTAIYMSLRLSRTKRRPQTFIDMERKHATFVGSAYSPVK